MKSAMTFCSNCGASLQWKIPQDDNRERHVCDSCGSVFYQNPLIVVGTIPVYQDNQILLCKRAIEPRREFWTLPAGFLENGESTEQGALRETLEESCAKVESLGIYRHYNVVYARQVHVFYRVHLPDTCFSTTPESLEVKLFSLDEIPWSQLSFPTVRQVLKDFVNESRSQQFTFQSYDISKDDWQHLDNEPDK